MRLFKMFLGLFLCVMVFSCTESTDLTTTEESSEFVVDEKLNSLIAEINDKMVEIYKENSISAEMLAEAYRNNELEKFDALFVDAELELLFEEQHDYINKMYSDVEPCTTCGSFYEVSIEEMTEALDLFLNPKVTNREDDTAACIQSCLALLHACQPPNHWICQMQYSMCVGLCTVTRGGSTL